jgi:ribosomal protein S8E
MRPSVRHAGGPGRVSRTIRTFRAGTAGVVIAGVAVVDVIAAIVIWSKPSQSLYTAATVLSGGAVVAAVVIALDKINAANSIISSGASISISASETAYSYGAGVSLLSSFTMLTAALAGRAKSTVTASTPNPTPDY